jgi:hypothetical protein
MCNHSFNQQNNPKKNETFKNKTKQMNKTRYPEKDRKTEREREREREREENYLV